MKAWLIAFPALEIVMSTIRLSYYCHKDRYDDDMDVQENLKTMQVVLQIINTSFAIIIYTKAIRYFKENILKLNRVNLDETADMNDYTLRQNQS